MLPIFRGFGPAVFVVLIFLAGCGGGALVPAAGPSTNAPGGGGPALLESWQSLPLAVVWLDGSTVGEWIARYDGFGKTQVVAATAGARNLELAPLASKDAAETHAGLVTSARRFGDLDASVALQTLVQLRVPSPNAWETGWVLWHYRDDQHFYYLVLKPNGWELGKEDPAYPDAQRFLATGEERVFPIGSWNVVRITQRGSSISAYANGALLTTFEDDERPYLDGAIGLYCEDAKVRFGTVSIQ